MTHKFPGSNAARFFWFQKSNPNVSGSSFANERIAANGFFPHASRRRVLFKPSRNGVFTANSRAEIVLCRPDCVRRVDAVVNLTIFNSDQRPGPSRTRELTTRILVVVKVMSALLP
jgi:hypothetical protein